MTFLADGSQAFQKLSKSYGLFTNVRSLIVMKGKKELQDLKEKLGYYGEDLVLAITDLGLGTCWVGGTFDKDELMADDSEELVCVVLVGRVNHKRSTIASMDRKRNESRTACPKC